MKKSIIVLSILVGGLFSTNLLEAKSFAQNDTNNTVMNQTIQLNQEDAHQRAPCTCEVAAIYQRAYHSLFSSSFGCVHKH